MTQLRSPLQAQVVQWLVAPGDAVREGDVLVILEAMKMEHEVRSPGDGVVGERFFAEGETVQQDEVLLTIAAASAPTPAAPQRGREPQPAPTAVRPDLRRVLEVRGPASLKVCALLDKPSRRKVPAAVDYIGFSIPDRFVIGYGLDFDQRFRQLPHIAVVTALDEG